VALGPGKGALKKKLKPVFETVVQRTTIPVESCGSRIEIAVDQGNIRTAGRCAPIREIELELKAGDPAAFGALVRYLSRKMVLTPGLDSKAERGYALRADKEHGVVHAENIELARDLSVEQGLKAVAHSCLRHWVRNAPAVRARDPEGIHQMRVGLRRFRAALSVFKPVLQDKQSETLKAELKWLTDELGPARDFDVYVANTIAPVDRDGPAKGDIAALKADFEEKRDEGFARAIRAVTGDRFRRLVLDAALWIVCGDWSTSADALRRSRRQQPLTDFAGQALTQRTEKIVRKVKKLADLDERRRHKLRIAVKKLRYATEFFQSLFPSGKAAARRKTFARVLKALQDSLGTLNDIRVHNAIVDKLLRKPPPSREAFAAGYLTGHEQRDMRHCLKQTAHAGKDLKAARQFWT
jgi:inorganic triphosphatase YgiF